MFKFKKTKANQNTTKLWTRDFTLLTLATAFGALGNIAGGFALSFLVYEETASTLASALIVALRMIPGLVMPLLLSPMMDRLPRKPFLVGCDAIAAVIYVLAGLFLKNHDFEYIHYLLFSLVIAILGSMDEMSYSAIFPRIIPKGAEEKGYTVSSMLYPVLMVVMMPISAVLYKTIGVANILLAQGVLCLLTSMTESRIRVREEIKPGTRFSFKQWWGDIKEVFGFLKFEKGLMAMTVNSAVTNGLYSGYEPLLVAFFSSMPGFTVTMYSFFSLFEVVGRSLGGVFLYKKEIPKEKKSKFALFIHLFYDTMDAALLWLPYPLMLINRTMCGFLGIQSGTMRTAAIQKYIPDDMRARINAFQSILFFAFSMVLSVGVGALGEVLDLRIVMSLCGVVSISVCLLTLFRQRKHVDRIYIVEISE